MEARGSGDLGEEILAFRELARLRGPDKAERILAFPKVRFLREQRTQSNTLPCELIRLADILSSREA
ncbi:MAG: hypothetical protein UU67_C0029G0006 [Candidatus Daviesbacteria bacterium GW2011_GWB1_41_5]|nr:MAG: hypothetical protein UU67_C0029G0006 [Candidatus Daviesbacteria bacterium GW2011_GWB1_41_5]